MPGWRQRDARSLSGRCKKRCRDKDTDSHYREEEIAILPTPRNEDLVPEIFIAQESNERTPNGWRSIL